MRDVPPHTRSVEKPVKLFAKLLIHHYFTEVTPEVDPEEPSNGVNALRPGEIVKWVVKDVSHSCLHGWHRDGDDKGHDS